MKQVSNTVKKFFEAYEKNNTVSDPDLIGLQYADAFMFGGPQGVQVVKKEDFLKALPKQDSFFKAAGLKTSSIQSLEETRLDENYVMVKVDWNMGFEKHSGQAVDVALTATYVLFKQGALLRIVFQLDHQDFMKNVQDLGLFK